MILLLAELSLLLLFFSYFDSVASDLLGSLSPLSASEDDLRVNGSSKKSSANHHVRAILHHNNNKSVFAESSSFVLRDLSTTTNNINPYTSGCLHAKELITQMRVCNSEDSADDVTNGVCRVPDIEYMEIRIFSDNWDSITFEAWILQIILSELLDVPTTVETGSFDGSLNFYHPDAPMEYGTPRSDNDALIVAHSKGDCRDSKKDMVNYEACAHIDPERWTGIQYSSPLRDLVHDSVIEPPQTLGTLGLETWFITKFSAVTDPTLDSYLGLAGEVNRQKMAELFLRPTSWQDYCEQISADNCTIPDTVAQRPPTSAEETEQFYSDGYFIGHFRATDDNNCTANPTTCTGHVADFPCFWNSYMLPQIHYLNIALKSTGPERPLGGYPYERLVEMWRAANATKSNLMMQFWLPEPVYQEFLGTDAEFIRVTLPTRTQECLNSRRPQDDMCSEDESIRLGSPEGICEESSKPLWKIVVGNLYDQINDPTIPIPIRSPAYDVLQLFQMSELQLGQIFDFRRNESTPRDAVCRWVSENIDYVQTFIPRSYPRTTQTNRGGEPIIYISTIAGGLTTVVVLMTWVMVYRRRELRAIRTAQIEFLHLLLSGAFLISVGAIIVGLPPSHPACIAAIWAINLGYTLELVPLIVKVAAINKLMGAARQFRRIVLTRKSLFGAVLGISFMVFIFLLIWTIIDPPNKNQEYALTNNVMTDVMGNNRTIVDVVYFCSSESLVWDYVAVGWNVALLVCATVLAVQTRTVQKDFNESQTLAFLIYSHFLFVVLRLILLMLSSGTSSTVSQSTLSGLRSLIFSADTVATVIVYFLPKLLSINNNDPNYSASLSYTASAIGRGGTHVSGSIIAMNVESTSNENVTEQEIITEISGGSLLSPESSSTTAISGSGTHVSGSFVASGNWNIQSTKIANEKDEEEVFTDVPYDGNHICLESTGSVSPNHQSNNEEDSIVENNREQEQRKNDENTTQASINTIPTTTTTMEESTIVTLQTSKRL